MPDLFTKPVKHNNKTRIGIFSAFSQSPMGVVFQAQDLDEEIILFLRAHFVTNLPWILAVSTFFTLPFVFILFPDLLTSPIFSGIPLSFYPVIFAFYYLIVAIYGFVEFITWFYNISLVTTKRVMDVDFSSLLYHNVALTKLELIEDVDYTSVGVIRSLFDYGDVFVQTAGEMTHFDFLAVPKPAQVVEIILDLIGGKHES